ncbi:MAG: hypothetical protein CMG46_04195 [Candidatus Marinimicrobia bacterium]|nr:hypothetical protein [Candidatus Neomarinimicrobiota bacterium]
MNHDKDYPVEFINQILQEVKTIAIVGASKNPKKFSYEVLRVLHETGYNVIPVNPKEESNDIYGLKCYGSLSSIQHPVDMVDIFRNSEAVYEVTEEAIKIGAKVIWMQIGVRNDKAAEVAEAAGLKVIMNRCPKIELLRSLKGPLIN